MSTVVISSGIWMIGGVIVGILASLGVSIIRNYFNRPVIIIETDIPLQGNNSVIHSIKIVNKGRTAAKNCYATLSVKGLSANDIINTTQKAFVKTNSFRPIEDEPLCWAFAALKQDGSMFNPVYLPIYPHSSQLIDLCSIDNISQNIAIPSEAGWDTLRVILKGSKDYKIELKIFAENIIYNRKTHIKSFMMNGTKNLDEQVIPITS